MILQSKRGVSPLIATVLLIAFAVALGAVVMNWSYKYAPEVDTCGDVFVAFETFQGKPDICFDAKQQVLLFTLNNQGDGIDGAKITIIGSKNSYEVQEDFDLAEKSIRKLGVPYDATEYGSSKKLIVLPYQIYSEGPVFCEQKRFEAEAIALCQ